MSIFQSPMYANQLSSPFATASHHARASSFNELISQFRPRTSTRKMRSVSPSSFSSPEFHSLSRKRRSHSDQTDMCSPGRYPASGTSAEFQGSTELPALKRPRTAPTSPKLAPFHSEPSGSPDNSPITAPAKITLPSISDALAAAGSATSENSSYRHNQQIKVSAPTVSLDYFDTYKPNDENWRYGLLDSIRNAKPALLSDNFGYLESHSKSKKATLPTDFGTAGRPSFDSRVSSKAMPKLQQRKINFPYESNYTYLNQTYLHDVEKFPEYLELAQSLIQLSRPQASPPKSQTSSRPAAPGKAQIIEFEQRAQPKVRASDPHRYTSNARSNSHDAPPSPQYVAYAAGQHTSHVLPSPSSSQFAGASQFSYATPDQSFEMRPISPSQSRASADIQQERSLSASSASQRSPQSPHKTTFIPITPPCVKDKSRSDLMKSPPRVTQGIPRTCISCGSDQSPCWRPSWSASEGQLCNSCGLRYKKTAARCLNSECKKIPAKGEWALMQSKGRSAFEDGEFAYACLNCACKVEVK